jgi:hypothetical protein
MKLTRRCLILFLGVLIAPAMAAAYCPQRADNLAAFAACMAPMRGTIGMVSYVANGAAYDGAHAQLMSAMQAQASVPPHVVPAVPPPNYYPMAPFYGFASPYGSSSPFGAFYPMIGATAAVYGANPAFWYLYGMSRVRTY